MIDRDALHRGLVGTMGPGTTATPAGQSQGPSESLTWCSWPAIAPGSRPWWPVSGPATACRCRSSTSIWSGTTITRRSAGFGSAGPFPEADIAREAEMLTVNGRAVLQTTLTPDLASGSGATVPTGALSKLLRRSLVPLPRWARVRITATVMRGMAHPLMQSK